MDQSSEYVKMCAALVGLQKLHLESQIQRVKTYQANPIEGFTPTKDIYHYKNDKGRVTPTWLIPLDELINMFSPNGFVLKLDMGFNDYIAMGASEGSFIGDTPEKAFMKLFMYEHNKKEWDISKEDWVNAK